MSAVVAISSLSHEACAALLRLNNDHAVETSYLDPSSWTTMLARAFHATAFSPPDAFLLTFDHDADYGSPNFRWFRARLDRFVYVDRIIVSAALRGRGAGRALYDDLFAVAAARGHSRIVCEVNADPPNPTSDAFHAAMRFEPVGTAVLPNGKTVTYLERRL